MPEEDEDAASATAPWRAAHAAAAATAAQVAVPRVAPPACRPVPIYGALLANGGAGAAIRRGVMAPAFGVGAAVAAATAALAADDAAVDSYDGGAAAAGPGPGIAFRANSLQSLLQIVNAGGMSNEDFLASLARGGLRSVLRQPGGASSTQQRHHLQSLPYEDGDGAY